MNSRNTSRGSRNNHFAGKQQVSTIKLSQLIKKAEITETQDFKSSMLFEEMKLNRALINNILDKGFVNPTQIQEESITPLLEGKDLVGIANTGTGKTAAFLIPIIEKTLKKSTEACSLVIVPTRELALQVEIEFLELTKGFGLRVASFIGGTNVAKDLEKLQKRNHLIIGTPGRLIDLQDRKVLDFAAVKTLVIDEFDRMLDMGFINDIRKMVMMMENRSQTMLFSATIDNSQEEIINKIVTDPVNVKVSSGETTNSNIEQNVLYVPDDENKVDFLINLLNKEEFKKVIIFAETKRLVDRVSKRLIQAGIKTSLIHGDKSQSYRNSAINKFKSNFTQVLLATDVAARGIDVDDVSHVINYEIPMTMDSYVHRIGRTGRGGKLGTALTFIN